MEVGSSMTGKMDMTIDLESRAQPRGNDRSRQVLEGGGGVARHDTEPPI